MNLDEYLKLAARGAPITVISPDGSAVVAHCWPQMLATQRGWEYVLADYHGNILGQAWSAGGERERDKDVAASIAKLEKMVAARAVA